MPILIFDFNKTLFQPETNALYPDALTTCKTLRLRGYQLLLLSQEKTERQALIQSLGLERIFDRIVITPTKNIAVFQALLDGLETQETYVIGDGADREIRLGHELGFRSIWVDRSRGEIPYPAHLTPPWKIIHELYELEATLP